MKFYIRLYFISRFSPNVDCGDPLDKTALSDYTVYAYRNTVRGLYAQLKYQTHQICRFMRR